MVVEVQQQIAEGVDQVVGGAEGWRSKNLQARAKKKKSPSKMRQIKILENKLAVEVAIFNKLQQHWDVVVVVVVDVDAEIVEVGQEAATEI